MKKKQFRKTFQRITDYLVEHSQHSLAVRCISYRSGSRRPRPDFFIRGIRFFRALPCGHSLCGPKTANGCLAKLEDDGEITCPSCRTIHEVSPFKSQSNILHSRQILQVKVNKIFKIKATLRLPTRSYV